MKVLVTGKQDHRVMLALAMLQMEIVMADSFEAEQPKVFTIRDRLDEPPIPRIAPDPGNTYGPPVKGRGGKVKRW